MKERNDDFELRAKHLQGMTDEELDKYFWELTEKVVNPLVNLAETHTSQSIERSVLLRMGFNSLQASKLVDRIFEKKSAFKRSRKCYLQSFKRIKFRYYKNRYRNGRRQTLGNSRCPF